MSDKHNKIWLLLLNLSSILSQFIVYKLIYKFLGSEEMGLWSILSAATTLGIVSNFGFSSGLIKFVAEFVAKRTTNRLSVYIGTSNAANIFLSIPLLVFFYYLSNFFAKPILSKLYFAEFQTVLPFCLFSLYLSNIGSSFVSLLDGYKKYKIRCQIQLIGVIIYSLISSFFIKSHGLAAIAYGLCLQNFFILVTSSYFSYQQKIISSIFPINFKITIFSKLANYGLKFQAINILVFLFDPLVKFFITQKFGLHITGIYELTNKIIIQIRTIVTNLLQVITPTVAALKKKEELSAYIMANLKTNTFIAINVSILALFIFPLFSFIFLGQLSQSYIYCSSIMLIAWLTTMLTAPLYFACLGLGKLTILIIQHLLYSVVSAILFYLLSSYLNTNSVFFIPAISLVVGSLFLSYQIKKYINVSVTSVAKQYLVYFILFAAALISIFQFFSAYFQLGIVFSSIILFVWVIIFAKSAEVKMLSKNLFSNTLK